MSGMNQEVFWNKVWDESVRSAERYLWAETWISLPGEQRAILKTLRKTEKTENSNPEADDQTVKTSEEKETIERSDKWLNLENFWIPKSGLPDAQNPEPSIKVTEAIEPAKKGLWESFTNRRKRN